MAHHFTFQVNVSVERTQGKFAARDDMAEQLAEALEGADPGTLSGLGEDGDSEYDVIEFEVSEVTA